MPWPVYSETFIRHTGTQTWAYYNVPAGKVIVVKSISFTNWGNAAGKIHVQAASAYIAIGNPASISTLVVPVMAVLHAGDQIGVYNDGTTLHCMVSGYLFDAAQLRRGGWYDQVEDADTPPPPGALADQESP